MKVKLDREANSLHIRFSDEKIVESAEVRPGVTLGYDAKGRIVALEILNASQTLSGPDRDGLAVDVS